MLESALERDHNARPYEKTIRKLGEIVKDDQALYEELSQTPDKESFIDKYVAMGAERDLKFTRDELMVAVQEQKQGKDWVIPKKVLGLIAERF